MAPWQGSDPLDLRALRNEIDNLAECVEGNLLAAVPFPGTKENGCEAARRACLEQEAQEAVARARDRALAAEARLAAARRRDDDRLAAANDHCRR